MIDVERTSYLKRKLESMKPSTNQPSEDSKEKVANFISGLLTALLRAAFLFFSQYILINKYQLGSTFAFWEVLVLYWGLGSITALFKSTGK